MAERNNAAQREHARRAITEYNRKVRPFLQLCGAQCRGQPGKFCARIPVKGRQRCELHGGKTPRGKQWHQPQRPNGSRKSDEWRAANKLKTAELRRKELVARLAAMTEEEREAYDRYSRAARPGTQAEREDRKRTRQLKKEWANIFDEQRPMSPEARAIQDEINRLRAILEQARRPDAPNATEPAAEALPSIFD
jgi:hypothetical protein